MRWFKEWRRKRACFHHNPKTGESFLRDTMIHSGSSKMFWCTRCNQDWTLDQIERAGL